MGCHFLLRESSHPRDWTLVSCIAGRFFTIWATREAQQLSQPIWDKVSGVSRTFHSIHLYQKYNLQFFSLYVDWLFTPFALIVSFNAKTFLILMKTDYLFFFCCLCFGDIGSVKFSHSVVSNSLQPHILQHTRLCCPSLTPRACSNSCPPSPWCHPSISSSVIPFSSSLQSFSESGFFPMSQIFSSGGQSVGALA